MCVAPCTREVPSAKCLVYEGLYKGLDTLDPLVHEAHGGYSYTVVISVKHKCTV